MTMNQRSWHVFGFYFSEASEAQSFLYQKSCVCVDLCAGNAARFLEFVLICAQWSASRHGRSEHRFTPVETCCVVFCSCPGSHSSPPISIPAVVSPFGRISHFHAFIGFLGVSFGADPCIPWCDYRTPNRFWILGNFVVFYRLRFQGGRGVIPCGCGTQYITNNLLLNGGLFCFSQTAKKSKFPQIILSRILQKT